MIIEFKSSKKGCEHAIIKGEQSILLILPKFAAIWQLKSHNVR